MSTGQVPQQEPIDPETQWWKEDAARNNAAGRTALELGLVEGVEADQPEAGESEDVDTEESVTDDGDTGEFKPDQPDEE